MSILSKARISSEIPTDNVYVIYGAPGSGKTTVASTFPKTKEAPMLYIDVLEGGTGVIMPADRELIQVVQITDYTQLSEVMTDLTRGFTVTETGEKVMLKYSTICIDSITQLEYILKEWLKKANAKDTMTLNLWGQLKENNEYIFNLLKLLHMRTGAHIVALAHEKEMRDDNNPDFNKLIPSLMQSSAVSLCGKASFVWYCKIEEETDIDPKTSKAVTRLQYMTYIDAHPYLVSKCRKPATFQCPQKVENLTYNKFQKNVLDKIK
jgi:adenylate kinase family enzyme